VSPLFALADRQPFRSLLAKAFAASSPESAALVSCRLPSPAAACRLLGPGSAAAPAACRLLDARSAAGPAAEGGLPSAARPQVRTTVAATKLEAGVADNVLPQQGTINLNFRLLPGHGINYTIDYLKSVIRPRWGRSAVAQPPPLPTRWLAPASA
jgi:acetylornithine deacetylase/succinyl-diaminopimelate desuccinylase-like protein